MWSAVPAAMMRGGQKCQSVGFNAMDFGTT